MNPVSRQEPKNPLLIPKGSWFFLIYLAFYTVWLILESHHGSEVAGIDNLAATLVAIAVTGLLFNFSSIKIVFHRLPMARLLLGAGLLCWAFSNTLEAMDGLSTLQPIFMSPAITTFTLAGYAVILAGYLLYPRPLRKGPQKIRLYGDVLIVTAAILTFCWLACNPTSFYQSFHFFGRTPKSCSFSHC